MLRGLWRLTWLEIKIFFREPLGALGRPVTPHVTVAADPKFVPLGAPVWLDLDRAESALRDAATLWLARDIQIYEDDTRQVMFNGARAHKPGANDYRQQLTDADATVSKLKKEPLNYAMLAELNTRPRTTYLARLKNPNSDLGVKK